MPSQAQIKAQTKWEKKVYDKVLLRLRKDTEPTRDSIAEAAKECGESLNEYIINAIRERMQGGSDPPEIIPEITREPFYDN